MASIRSRGNLTTEIGLARLLRSTHIKGWRRHQPLAGKPDFIFEQKRLAVFVDGCFWHGCPKCYRMPEDNRAYWSQKVTKNRDRDKRNTQELRADGWRVIRIWEHALKNPRGRATVLVRLRKALRA